MIYTNCFSIKAIVEILVVLVVKINTGIFTGNEDHNVNLMFLIQLIFFLI